MRLRMWGSSYSCCGLLALVMVVRAQSESTAEECTARHLLRLLCPHSHRCIPQCHACVSALRWWVESDALSLAALSKKVHSKMAQDYQCVAELMQQQLLRSLLQGPLQWRWRLAVAPRLGQLAQLQGVGAADTCQHLLGPARCSQTYHEMQVVTHLTNHR